MVHSAKWGVVGLHKGIAWAGDVQRRVMQEGTQESAGQGGLAGAKRALQ